MASSKEKYQAWMEIQEKKQKAWGQIVAKAWGDPEFKKQFMENPKAVFKDYGVEVPEEINLKILEDSPEAHYLVFPEKLPEEISEEVLAKTSAGSFSYPFSSFS